MELIESGGCQIRRKHLEGGEDRVGNTLPERLRRKNLPKKKKTQKDRQRALSVMGVYARRLRKEPITTNQGKRW